MAAPKVVSHWRDSRKNARFFGIDARSTFPLLLFLVHIRLGHLYYCSGHFIFWYIRALCFRAVVFLRMFRSLLAGSRKMTRPWWREDKVVNI